MSLTSTEHYQGSRGIQTVVLYTFFCWQIDETFLSLKRIKTAKSNQNSKLNHNILSSFDFVKISLTLTTKTKNQQRTDLTNKRKWGIKLTWISLMLHKLHISGQQGPLYPYPCPAYPRTSCLKKHPGVFSVLHHPLYEYLGTVLYIKVCAKTGKYKPAVNSNSELNFGRDLSDNGISWSGPID